MNTPSSSDRHAKSATHATLESILRAEFSPSQLLIQDDSHLHAGHAGAREGQHFTVGIVSERFNGLPRVARHRLVYDALGNLTARGIHALALKTHTAEELAVQPQPSSGRVDASA